MFMFVKFVNCYYCFVKYIRCYCCSSWRMEDISHIYSAHIWTWPYSYRFCLKLFTFERGLQRSPLLSSQKRKFITGTSSLEAMQVKIDWFIFNDESTMRILSHTFDFDIIYLFKNQSPTILFLKMYHHVIPESAMYILHCIRKVRKWRKFHNSIHFNFVYLISFTNANERRVNYNLSNYNLSEKLDIEKLACTCLFHRCHIFVLINIYEIHVPFQHNM